MVTMNEMFDRYVAERIPLLAKSTQADYKRHVVSLREHFGDRDPTSIKRRDIGRFLDVPTGKIIRNKRAMVLSAVFSNIVGRWFIEGCDYNPCHGVKKNKEYPRTRYITDAEFNAVRALAPVKVQIMMDLAYLTGQRQGDLLDLRWDRVLPEAILFVQSKTKKKLGVRITPRLRRVLQRAAIQPPFQPRTHVIRTYKGTPYTHDGFRVYWQRTMDDAMARGVISERFTFHDIRAKCASDSKDLHAASMLLGHQSITMTKTVYDRGFRIVDALA